MVLDVKPECLLHCCYAVVTLGEFFVAKPFQKNKVIAAAQRQPFPIKNRL